MTKTKSILSKIVIVVITALTISLPTFAQKGEKSLSIKAGYATFNEGGFTALQFQYTFGQHLRIAPEIGYVFRNAGVSGLELCADMHFPFRIGKGVNIYPLAGLTFNSWNWQHSKHSTSRVGLDFGGGFDFYLTQNLKLGLQGKYSMMNDTSGGFFDASIGYVF